MALNLLQFCSGAATIIFDLNTYFDCTLLHSIHRKSCRKSNFNIFQLLEGESTSFEVEYISYIFIRIPFSTLFNCLKSHFSKIGIV